MQHKVALAYWSLPLLLPFVGAEIRAVALSREEWWLDPLLARRMHSATRAMLLVVADNYTAWNHRKRLVQLAGFCRLAEISLVDLVQSKHHKSQETWAHRRWLVAPLLRSDKGRTEAPCEQEAREDGHQPAATNAVSSERAALTLKVVERELQVTERAAVQYRKNYNAWTHRMWVVSHLPREQLADLTESCRQHCRANVSDIAAQHFRCVLVQLRVRHLLGNGSNIGEESWEGAGAEARALVASEVQISQEMIATFPGHESLWMSLRWLYEIALSCGRGGRVSRDRSRLWMGGDALSSRAEVMPVRLSSHEVEQEVCTWLHLLEETVRTKAQGQWQAPAESAGSADSAEFVAIATGGATDEHAGPAQSDPVPGHAGATCAGEGQRREDQDPSACSSDAEALVG